MLFSSIPFLYYFLPIVLILYLAVPKKKTMLWANLVLLASSLFFYYWGEPKYVYLMAGSILLGWIFGLLIEKAVRKTTKKVFLAIYTALVLGALVYFKYAGFFTKNLQMLFSSMPILKVALPIGISFYTFQILSYAIDVYRGTVPAQKNPISFGAYISMFPQLIAGPIVRYRDIESQLDSRTTTLADLQEGLAKFIIGLAKKILIANQLGEFCDIFRASGEKSVLFYWMFAFAYALHVYFDFSGYSDMAIGLGRIFGFHFMKNFDYPFISKSITEFWRRWHISLGTWFRDYVYIPMGGNRVKPMRHVFNILVVWALTGFWHGAEWNFLLWGLFYAILLIMEKRITISHLERIPVVLRHVFTIVITMFGFVLFAANGLHQAFADIGSMLGLSSLSFLTNETLYYLRSYSVILLIGTIAATPFFKNITEKIRSNQAADTALSMLRPIVLIILFILCTAYLVDGSFNPFLYFRF